MIAGNLIINGKAVKRESQAPRLIPVDANSPCGSDRDPALHNFRVRGRRRQALLPGADHARNPAQWRAPTRRSSSAGSQTDNFGPIRIPDKHLWLMGDNRDDSADSRVRRMAGRARRHRAVGEYRRARRVHHLLARRHHRMVESADLVRSLPLRPRRQARSGTADGRSRRPPSPISSGLVRRSFAIRWFAGRWPRPRCGSAWPCSSPASSSLPSRCC